MNEETKIEIVSDELEVEPVVVEPEPAPAEPAANTKADKLAEQLKSKAAPKLQESAVSHVVSGNETDDVRLSSCVYKNMYARKSLTVHHVQRRLLELGYPDGGTDKDGWYGDMTKSAVAQFQKDKSFAGEGLMDAATLRALFEGDSNVTVVA